MAECAHPFSLVTKSSGIERDLDLVAPMAARGLVAVYVSVTSLDPQLARILEPRAAAPHRRLKTVETLARAGVPVGVSISPIIPFINEPEIERVLEAAAAAGASSAFGIVLRLPWEVNPIFQRWLDQHFPDRAARVMARVREMRGGKDYDASFGTRMKGEGVWAQLLQQRLAKARKRYGLDRERVRPRPHPVQEAPAAKARRPDRPLRLKGRRRRPPLPPGGRGAKRGGCNPVSRRLEPAPPASSLEQILHPIAPGLGVRRMPVARLLQALVELLHAACAGAR